ncbi:flagellar hook-basal body complex protein FliE [Betaproteobacteria bacterium]|nr:flagellar hook-basal body complex protein FliE [Betaproteobacteria bacterium]GHT93421.1 flagellar hook-basal body complex protein FliE [Betaproteobacteria bacterium]GHT97690.1 flagellar hook-basal body complex protein FliE [Betaproteobacteria bacterium]GHU12122.1 flagellar hook-basal body complex protein FliE [Betaproteobacteria bacterium]GHU18838.1 flagellar hook-basal body complex protein FliE [Betaproteobacteria bacterium]
MDTRGIEQMLSELRSVAQTAQNKPAASAADAVAGGVSFADVLNNTLKDVSTAQKEARAMAEDFSSGNPNVNLQDVMVNLQKANLSFQQMVQVRNRLVSAYQDIMNMPV